tara:strand:- start:3993 stop:4922 length:930 start_codon:yes stop_codon:yes gene_type:complete
MSGASAVASARRRRAEPIPQTITPSTLNTTPTARNNNDDEPQKQSVTPLQILQAHDLKIKEIETTLESKVVEIAKSVLEENLKHLKLDNISSISSDDGSLVKRIDKLTENLEELKLLVIKNQTLGLETNSELFKQKNDSVEIMSKMTLLETASSANYNVNEKLMTRLTKIEENVYELQNMIKDDDDNFNEHFNFEEGGAAEMLLKSMMQGSFNVPTNRDNKEEVEQELHTLNIHDNESDVSNDIGDVSELTLTESELNSIKDEVKKDLKEELINLENLTGENEENEEKQEKEENQKDNLIEVSDNEANE